MSSSERTEVLRATRRALGPEGYVFANVSSCAVEESVELSRLALDSGASPDALLLLPPFYHKPFSADSGCASLGLSASSMSP